MRMAAIVPLDKVRLHGPSPEMGLKAAEVEAAEFVIITWASAHGRYG